jgi:hypothetical protein
MTEAAATPVGFTQYLASTEYPFRHSIVTEGITKVIWLDVSLVQ